MSDTNPLMPVLEALYMPVFRLAGAVPYARALLIVVGLTVLVTAINLRGSARFFAILGGIYLLGGAWMLRHAAGTSF